MTSNFKSEKDDVIGAYIDSLIQHICKVEPGTKNYQLAEEFAMSNIENHQFLDINPNQVERSKDVKNMWESSLLISTP